MIKTLLIFMNVQKGVKTPFCKNGEEYLNNKFIHYKVKFIFKILIIYFMNIYFLAFLLALVDVYYCNKLILKNFKFSKTLLLLIFLISFYIILVILKFLSKFMSN